MVKMRNIDIYIYSIIFKVAYLIMSINPVICVSFYSFNILRIPLTRHTVQYLLFIMRAVNTNISVFKIVGELIEQLKYY